MVRVPIILVSLSLVTAWLPQDLIATEIYASPQTVFNFCATTPFGLGVDSSQLIMRNRSPAPALRDFCELHLLSQQDCTTVTRKVHDLLLSPEHVLEFAWIVTLDEGELSRSMPLLNVSARCFQPRFPYRCHEDIDVLLSKC